MQKSNSDILPADTIMVDLIPSEHDILSAMKPKTRYNIGLSYRKGINVRVGTIEDLKIWYDLYLETAKRDGLHINEFYYFHSVFATQMEDSVKVKLLIAYLDDIPLAAMFLIISNHRATYLYGASSSQMRNYMLLTPSNGRPCKLQKPRLYRIRYVWRFTKRRSFSSNAWFTSI